MQREAIVYLVSKLELDGRISEACEIITNDAPRIEGRRNRKWDRAYIVFITTLFHQKDPLYSVRQWVLDAKCAVLAK